MFSLIDYLSVVIYLIVGIFITLNEIHCVEINVFPDIDIIPAPLKLEEGNLVLFKINPKAPPEEKKSPWIGKVTKTTARKISFDWIIRDKEGALRAHLVQPASGNIPRSEVIAKLCLKLNRRITENAWRKLLQMSGVDV